MSDGVKTDLLELTGEEQERQCTRKRYEPP